MAPPNRDAATLSRNDFLRLVLGATGLALLAPACGDSSDDAPDSGTGNTTDAGNEPVDAGVEPVDAGEEPVDAGEEPVDAGEQECTPDATIGSNHGHLLMVPKADVDEGAEQVYDIQGSSGHPHTVTLSAADFAQLAQGNEVVVSSSTDAGHSHQVTVSCAST